MVESNRSPIGVIVNANLRRYVPVWENSAVCAACEAAAHGNNPSMSAGALDS